MAVLGRGGPVAEGGEGVTWPSETFWCSVSESRMLLGVAQAALGREWKCAPCHRRRSNHVKGTQVCFRELNRKTGSNCTRGSEEQERMRAGVGLPGEEMSFFSLGEMALVPVLILKCYFRRTGKKGIAKEIPRV